MWTVQTSNFVEQRCDVDGVTAHDTEYVFFLTVVVEIIHIPKWKDTVCFQVFPQRPNRYVTCKTYDMYEYVLIFRFSRSVRNAEFGYKIQRQESDSH